VEHVAQTESLVVQAEFVEHWRFPSSPDGESAEIVPGAESVIEEKVSVPPSPFDRMPLIG